MKYLFSFFFFLYFSCIINAQKPQFNALIFSKTNGYRHEAIMKGVQAFKDMSEQHLFDYTWTEDASVFNPEALEKFDVIVFLNTNGNVLNKDQQQALEGFNKEGKGFMGIHAASATHNDWSWYMGLVGGSFKSHPYIQSAFITVEDNQHPATFHLSNKWLWTDEWYVFDKISENITVIMSVDESTYDPTYSWEETEGMGKTHPIAWYQEYEGGRSFYTGLGHMAKSYDDPMFIQHLWGGLYWAATGKKNK